jgi:methylenetetrahydrofolate--tRNA-(uracil-5-)-methyltransferase
MTNSTVWIVGGGLAGCEAALQLASRGHSVRLFEMRPVRNTEAHRSEQLAEMVCSNSFKSEMEDTSSGVFKRELDLLGSKILPLARQARVPGGAALALDREHFASLVTAAIESDARIELIREEMTGIPEHRPCLIATGPLTSKALESALAEKLGAEGLYFYDAIAPSVLTESIDQEAAYRAARYDKGEADYWNCPMNRDEYEAFVDALLAADRVPMKDFERAAYFPGCMPIEAIAEKGRDSLRFGPMRPVGLIDPRSGRRPWAVVQLRQESRDGGLFGLVGCQTQMKYGEQERVFRMIPGLGRAEFARLGSLHRNSFIDSPRHLAADLSLRSEAGLSFAGQLIGGEGYVESLATGLLAALGIDAAIAGREFRPPPPETMLGSLLVYLLDETHKRLSPMNVNFGLLPPLEDPPRPKKERKLAYGRRAIAAMGPWAEANLCQAN